MEQQFNETEALKVIRQSIEQTKDDFKQRGLAYFLVGLVVFIAAITNFLLIEFKITDKLLLTFFSLTIILLVPGLYDRIKSFSKPVEDGFNPDMTKSSLHYLWRGVSLMLFIVLFFDFAVKGADIATVIPFTVIILLFGLFSYMSGAILKFKPLIIAGSVNTIVAMTAAQFFVKPYPEYELLLLAASALCSFIIPGYMLRAKRNNLTI